MSAALALLLAGAVWAEPGAAPCGAAGRAAGAADNPCWTAAFVPAAARAARAAGAGVPGRLCDGAVILNHGARGGAAFGPALQVIALDPARLAARGAGWLVDAAGRARGGRSGARPVRGRGRRRGRRGGGGAAAGRVPAVPLPASAGLLFFALALLGFIGSGRSAWRRAPLTRFGSGGPDAPCPWSDDGVSSLSDSPSSSGSRAAGGGGAFS